MKNISYNSYNIIFESLLDSGYSEAEAEQLICDVINDQREMDHLSERLHNIYNETKTSKIC